MRSTDKRITTSIQWLLFCISLSQSILKRRRLFREQIGMEKAREENPAAISLYQPEHWPLAPRDGSSWWNYNNCQTTCSTKVFFFSIMDRATGSTAAGVRSRQWSVCDKASWFQCSPESWFIGQVFIYITVLYFITCVYWEVPTVAVVSTEEPVFLVNLVHGDSWDYIRFEFWLVLGFLC